MTQAVVHCYPVVVNLEQLDDDDRSTLAKFVYGPRNGLKIERIIARDGTLIIVLRKNKGDRLFLLPEIDGKKQVVYHYLGKIGSMDNHKYESNSLVQGYYQKKVVELEEHYKKMACDIVDLRKKMDDLIFGIVPEEATVPEEGPKLVEKRLYYYAGDYLHLSDMQEEALAKPGSFLIGPGGSGKTTVGVMGLYKLRQILADFDFSDNKLHNKFLYYMTLKAGLARDTERGWEDSLYDKKDGRVRFGSYEDVTLKLHEKILSRYQVEDLTEALEKAETKEERAKLMKTDVFYVSFNKKGTGTYWLKDIHGEIHEGNFKDLSPTTIKNCRQELVDWARNNGHIPGDRLSQVSKDEGFTAWYKSFVNNMGNKRRSDLKISDDDWKALKSAKNKKKEKKLLDKIYAEFRIISGFDHVEDYLEYGHSRYHSHFPGDENRGKRQALFMIYANYMEMLRTKKQWNADFFAWPDSGDCIGCFLDEGQDMTTRQLRNVYEAMLKYHDKADNERPLGTVAVGSNQGLHGSVSVVDYIRKFLPLLHETSLDESHRCPELINDLSNRIVHAKLLAAGGSSYQGENAKSKLAETAKNKGKGTVRYFSEFSDQDLDRLKEQVKADADYVVITPASCLAEAQKLFGVEQVFTAEDIKGRQFKKILMWRPLAGENFADVDKLYADENCLNVEMNPHRAKLHKANQKYSKPFDEMNVACTRAMEEVLVYQPYQRGSELLADRLFGEHYCTTLEDRPKVNSTASDWEAYIRKIYRRKEDNEVAYNACLSVFVKKLGRKKEDFPRYLIHVGLEKASAATAKDEQTKSIAAKTENNQAKQEKSEEVNKKSPTSEALKVSNANSRKKPNNSKDKGTKNSKNSPEQTEKLGKVEPKGNQFMPKKATNKAKERRHVDIETADLEFAASAEAKELENEKEEGTFFRSKPLNAEQVKAAKKKGDAAIRAFEQENKEIMREHQVRSLKILGFTNEILSDVYLATGNDNEDFFRILFTTQAESGNKTLMIDALEDSKKMSELMSFLDNNPNAYSAFTPEMLTKIWPIKKNKKEDSICPLHLMLQTLNGHALLEKLFARNPNFAQEIINIDKLFVPPKAEKHPWRSYKCLDNGLFLLIRKEDENNNKINTASSAKILANLLTGPLYEKLFGNDVKPALIDVDGTTLLHYCIRIGNLDAVRAIINSPGFSLKLLEYKDYLLKCNTLQLCRHLINDIIPQNKNKLARDAEIATQKEIFSLLEAKILESQRTELFNNFTLEKITNTFFGEGCPDATNLSSEACEKACRNFASLLLLPKGVSKLSTNADTSFSPGLLTKVINDPEKRKVLVEFFSRNPKFIESICAYHTKMGALLVQNVFGAEGSIPFLFDLLRKPGQQAFKIFKSHAAMESNLFLDPSKLSKTTWSNLPAEESLFIKLLRQENKDKQTQYPDKTSVIRELFKEDNGVIVLIDLLRINNLTNFYSRFDKNGDSLIHFLAREGRMDILSILKDNDNFRTPMLLTSKNVNQQTVQNLLETLICRSCSLKEQLTEKLDNEQNETYKNKLNEQVTQCERKINALVDVAEWTIEIAHLLFFAADEKKLPRFVDEDRLAVLQQSIQLWETISKLNIGYSKITSGSIAKKVEVLKTELEKLTMIRSIAQNTSQSLIYNQSTGFFNQSNNRNKEPQDLPPQNIMKGKK